MKIQLKIVAFSLVIALLIPAVLVPTSLAANRSYAGTVIVDTGGNDYATAYSTAKIIAFIPDATFFFVDDFAHLQEIALKTIGDLIIVGHGQKDGMMIGGSVVNWSEIANLLSQSASSRFYLASCYSKAVQIDDKFVLGFAGRIDVDAAAMQVVAMYFGLNNQEDKIHTVINYFTGVLTDKVTHPERSYRAFLDTPPQGWQQAYKEGWVWAVYPEPQNLPQIHYTSPDVFYEYPWCTVDTEGSAWSAEGFGITHLTPSLLFEYSVWRIVEYAAAYLGVAAVLTGGIALLIAAILAIFSGVEALIVTNYVMQPNGDGWAYAMNYYSAEPYYGSVDIKIGALMWFTVGNILTEPFAYPNWYGGTDLGIDGI
jgi:hypothetical protein